MFKVDMAVTADTPEELLEALKSAGPNVHSFYGEVLPSAGETRVEITPTEVEPVAEPEEEKAEKPEEPASAPTMVEVRAALAKVREEKGSEAMREILRKHGAEKLADLDEALYAAVVAEANDAC